jgi:5-methyltetrahydropteroyltriglutamate--homocysteine methyltransferase
VLDDAMIDAVRLQEEAGLDVITDGEVRRATWAQTPRFLDCFTSFSDPGSYGQGLYGQGPYGPGAACPTVTGRVRDAARLGDMAADFESLTRYLKGRGDVPPRAKFTLPAPSYHRRYWSDERSKAAYSSVEEYLTEIRDYLREVISRLIALGCDYIQLDAPNYGALCDPAVRARMSGQGRDPMAELAFDSELDSSLLPGSLPPAGEPGGEPGGAGLTTALHICRNHGYRGTNDYRGNNPNGARRSAGGSDIDGYGIDGYDASGYGVAGSDAGGYDIGGNDASGYKAISAELFPRLRFDRLLLEYTPDQCAPNRYAPNRDCFEPLADVPDGTVVVLGLLAAPRDRLDPVRLNDDGPIDGPVDGPNTGDGPNTEAAAEAWIAEATRLKPLAELALSTRCGFATPAAQRTALEMTARIARRVWG